MKIQDSKSPKGELLFPFPRAHPGSASPTLTLLPLTDVTLMVALLYHEPLLNTRATLTSLPWSTPRLKGSLPKMPPLYPETAARSIQQLCLSDMGEGILPSYLPSEGSSPRRKGTAEGTGAELSVCYQKVSVIGTASRDPGGMANESQPAAEPKEATHILP